MKTTLPNKAAVLAAMPEHPAVKALLSWNADGLVDAHFDRDELTLTVAPERFGAALHALKAAGYNVFEDMTAVDWFPSEPRFQLSYHILSHAFKERIRLRVLVSGIDPVGGVDHASLAGGELLRARSLRSIRRSLRGASRICGAS